MAKVEVTFDLLEKSNQVQLRVYKPNGKFLEPLKQWYHIGDQWGLKIKTGHYTMKDPVPFYHFINKKIDELDKKKIPYELMFFNGTMYYKDIHNFSTKDGFNGVYTKILPRRISRFVD